MSTAEARTWERAQEREAAWWADCVNTYQEETKQRAIFAPRLGLRDVWNTDPAARGRWPVYDAEGMSIIDIGGGPVSLLLKCVRLGPGSTVLDPCDYPDWVWGRYEAAGLRTMRIPGEDLTDQPAWWDQAWIYNVLQHVIDPERVLANARECARSLRVVEWINIPADDLHPHALTARLLNKWLGCEGTVNWIPECGALVWSGRWDA